MTMTTHMHDLKLKTALIACAAMIPCGISAQSSIGLSQPGRLNIVRELHPAELALVSNSTEITYSDNDTCWVAGKKCKIRFKVQNIGEKNAKNSIIKIHCPDLPDDVTITRPPAKSIPAGAVAEIEVDLASEIKFESDTLTLNIGSEIPDGTNTQLQRLSVEKKAFNPPSVKIVGHAATKSGKNGTIARKCEFNLQVQIRNTNSGTAENVRVTLDLPYGVFLVSDSLAQEIPEMAPDEQKTVQFTLLLIGEYYKNLIPITVGVAEKWNRFGDSTKIDLKVGQKLASQSPSDKKGDTIGKQTKSKKKTGKRRRKGGRR